MPKELPHIPSELILIALDDLTKCEADPRYVIDMEVWHAPRDLDHRCAVCLAGAVMSQSLAAPLNINLAPYQDLGNSRALQALNCFRQGAVPDGLTFLGYGELHNWIDDEGYPRDIEITPYEDDPAHFRADMIALVKELKEQGL